MNVQLSEKCHRLTFLHGDAQRETGGKSTTPTTHLLFESKEHFFHQNFI